MFLRKLTFTDRRIGQTIIEMVVALGVLTIGFLGIVTLLNSSLGLHRVLADNYKATYLAAEGVEAIKSIVITNTDHSLHWCSGLPAGSYELDHTLRVPAIATDDCSSAYFGLVPDAGRFLVLHPATHLYDYDESSPFQRTAFRRVVTISYGPSPVLSAPPNDQMTVQSLVSWDDRTGHNEVNLVDYLFNSSST